MSSILLMPSDIASAVQLGCALLLLWQVAQSHGAHAGPLQALSTHMPMEPNGTPEGQALVDETEAIIKNLRGFQEQVALLDRIHSIRIRFIQV